MTEYTPWDVLYDSFTKPTWQEITAYIDNPLWREMNGYLKDAYGVNPELFYSSCAAQRGWNVKYKKGGKALCTLYPEKRFFIALVVIGGKEEEVVQALLPNFTAYVQKLYQNTRSMPMGRWLMIQVTDEEILKDVKTLIAIRVKPKLK